MKVYWIDFDKSIKLIGLETGGKCVSRIMKFNRLIYLMQGRGSTVTSVKEGGPLPQTPKIQ